MTRRFRLRWRVSDFRPGAGSQHPLPQNSSTHPDEKWESLRHPLERCDCPASSPLGDRALHNPGSFLLVGLDPFVQQYFTDLDSVGRLVVAVQPGCANLGLGTLLHSRPMPTTTATRVGAARGQKLNPN